MCLICLLIVLYIMSKRPYKPLHRYNTSHCGSTSTVESCSMWYMKPCSCVQFAVNTRKQKMTKWHLDDMNAAQWQRQNVTAIFHRPLQKLVTYLLRIHNSSRAPRTAQSKTSVKAVECFKHLTIFIDGLTCNFHLLLIYVYHIFEFYVSLTVHLGTILVNNQLDTQFFFLVCLLQFSTCFEQHRAHHKEN
jgi:hypothetical protein